MDTNLQLGYTGRYQDPVTGGYSLGNGYRPYLPELMRFARPDNFSPFGEGGVNPYVYCGDDPINHADPSGHISFPMGMLIFSVATLAVAGAFYAVAPVLGPLISAGIDLLAEGDANVGAVEAVSAVNEVATSENDVDIAAPDVAESSTREVEANQEARARATPAESSTRRVRFEEPDRSNNRSSGPAKPTLDDERAALWERQLKIYIPSLKNMGAAERRIEELSRMMGDPTMDKRGRRLERTITGISEKSGLPSSYYKYKEVRGIADQLSNVAERLEKNNHYASEMQEVDTLLNVKIESTHL